MFEYNIETGIFVWNWRSDMRIQWNGLWAGKQAGGLNSLGYRCIQINGVKYKAHRLAWFYMMGEWPEKEIDHINGNKDDNRWNNLRKATSLQNTAGRKMKKKRSFLRGVAELPSGRFRAVIGRNYKHIHLGVYDTPEEAHEKYCVVAKELYGEFAQFN